MGNENSNKEISKWPLNRKAKISKDILDTSASITPGVELSWRGKERHVKQEIGDITMVERIHIVPNLCVGTSPRPTSLQSIWSNKLIRGDNRVTMNALLSGRFSREIEAVGGIKLIYIDPPFFGGADYKISLSIGETSADRIKVVQDLAYKDSWEAGPSEYLNMMYGRLLLIKDLLADDGSIWVHCDWKANFMLRAILDEVFGSTAFRNEIIWYYTNKIPDTRKRQYTNATDTIFYYCKSAKSIFNWQFEKREKPIKVSQMKKVEGKKIYPKGADGKCVYVIREERTTDNVWKIPLLHAHPEMWGYPTQKPMRLLERIILTATNKGDLVADFFCGSGTLLEVAQKLGRKWIGCDSGKIAIHICRKRMIKTLDEEICKSKKIVGFDVLEAEEFKDLKFKKAVNSVLPNNFDNCEYNLTKNIVNFNVSIEINSFTIAVTLTDFRVDSGKTIDKIFDSKGKLGLSKIVINKGQLIKIVNERKDGERKYLLTQKWSDWIDYWAVDFEYDSNQSNQDMNNSTKSTVFESMWRSFRTPKKRSIKLTSAFWTYNHPGNYKIAVQVVDIFGNEMLKIFNVSIC